MATVRINKEQWLSGLKVASSNYKIIGPVKYEFGHLFKPLSQKEVPDLNFKNTVLSPKDIIFPKSEQIIKFTLDHPSKKQKIESLEIKVLPRVIVGIRPCDAKANLLLKMNFDTPENKDPYWLNLYNATTFIGLACNEPCSTCFCTSSNSSPYGTEGLDAILMLQENRYILKTITSKGEDFLNLAQWDNSNYNKVTSNIEELKSKAEAKISKAFQGTFKNLEKLETLELYNAPFWNNFSFSCLNCGICTYSCPTCWCFDIQDEVYKEIGFRVKNWDSCMFPIFTLHTTGHNPRKNKKDRFRQRFMHKLKYFLDKYEQGAMCVGCGRCIRSCPVNIDIRQILNAMINFKPRKTYTDQIK